MAVLLTVGAGAMEHPEGADALRYAVSSGLLTQQRAEKPGAGIPVTREQALRFYEAYGLDGPGESAYVYSTGFRSTGYR